MRWSTQKAVIFVAALVWCAFLGVVAARWIVSDSSAAGRGPTVLRTQDGVTQTGVVETVTVDGEVKRVIRWRTREGDIETQTVEGPTQFRTVQGDPIFLAGPTSTVNHTTTLPGHTVTVTTPGKTVTLPGNTVTQTVTQNNTVTEAVTQTVNNTVTETVTVVETVTQPPPP